MEIMRLMVTGPQGAGKSSFIQLFSQIHGHRVADTDGIELSRKSGTVTPNFGQLKVGPGQQVHLYKTPMEPGYPSFNFRWDVLLQKVHGCILLVPANQPQTFRHARLIQRFIEQRRSLPMIIGVTYCDAAESWDLNTVAIALGFADAPACPPMVRINHSSTSVGNAMLTLVNQMGELS
ncbi:MAG: GTPase [Cyanobacteria bacterium J06642_11]